MKKRGDILPVILVLVMALAIGVSGWLVTREETTEVRREAQSFSFDAMSIKAINYFPGEHTWGRMWYNWDFSVIREDFAQASAMHVNALRIFLYEDALGSSFPAASRSKVDDVLAEADRYNIKVIFDIILHNTSYPCENYSSNNQAFIQNVVSTYSNDSRILMWELTNEPHCGDNWGNLPADARARLRTGLEFIKSIDSSHPVSVPLFQDTIDDVSDIVDVFDVFNFHLYSYLDPTGRFALAQAHASGKPIFVGEFGCIAVQYHADWGNDLSWYCLNDANASTSQQQAAQADLYERYYNEAMARGFAGFAPWVFSEFAQPEPGTGAQNTPTESDRYFGIVKLDHSWTPAATKLSQLYNSCGNGKVDSGEDCDGSNLAGKSCVNLGYDSGSLSCSSDCRFDTSGCITTPPPPPPSSCGNGNIDSGEECDGGNFGGRSCLTFGYTTGNLNCTLNCLVDISTCSNPIDCNTDADCYGLQICNQSTHKCVCSSDVCSSPKVVNDTCDRCVCPTSCKEGQIQRADCTCQDITSEALSERNLILGIIKPDNEETFVQGKKIVFEAEAFYTNGDAVEETDLIWESDLQGEIGRGYLLYVSNLELGTHKITLYVENELMAEPINIHIISNNTITIYDVRPKEDSTVTDEEITIRALISSPKAEIDTTKTTLLLNEVDITEKANVAKTFVEYVGMEEAVIEGENTVSLSVENELDQTAQETWHFTYQKETDISFGEKDASDQLYKVVLFVAIAAFAVGLGLSAIIIIFRKKKAAEFPTKEIKRPLSREASEKSPIQPAG
jgi:hypothetical protein